MNGCSFSFSFLFPFSFVFARKRLLLISPLFFFFLTRRVPFHAFDISSSLLFSSSVSFLCSSFIPVFPLKNSCFFFFLLTLRRSPLLFHLARRAAALFSVYCVLFDPMVVTVREMTWPERTNELTTKTIKENEKQTNKQTMRNKNNNNNDRKKGKHTRSQMKERKSNNSRTDVTEGECALPCGGRGGGTLNGRPKGLRKKFCFSKA